LENIDQYIVNIFQYRGNIDSALSNNIAIYWSISRKYWKLLDKNIAIFAIFAIFGGKLSLFVNIGDQYFSLFYPRF